SRQFVFDVSSSGLNEGSTYKMNMPIVISTLENPRNRSFERKIFRSAAEIFRKDELYERVCLRIEQIRMDSAQSKKCRFSKSLGFGVIECAEDDEHTHFAPRALVRSRRRHVETTFLKRERGEKGREREREREGEKGERERRERGGEERGEREERER
ncbi:hypothetical protein PMAYCL1PPCAC_29302, partial [Pristionchus mayeri]